LLDDINPEKNEDGASKQISKIQEDITMRSQIVLISTFAILTSTTAISGQSSDISRSFQVGSGWFFLSSFDIIWEKQAVAEVLARQMSRTRSKEDLLALSIY